MSKHASFGSPEFFYESRKELPLGAVFYCKDSRLRLAAREDTRP